MVTPILIVGAGGFGREAIDVVEALNQGPYGPSYSLMGIADDSPSANDLDLLLKRGVNYLGTIDDVLSTSSREVRYVIGIGSPSARAKIDNVFQNSGFLPGTAIHPTAVIGSCFQAAPGTVICAGAQISTNVRLGAHVHINPGAIVGHDAVLSDYVSINPGAIVSGHVKVHSQALLGAGSIVLQGLAIGEGTVVGAGAVVVKDVSAWSVVKGVPAR